MRTAAAIALLILLTGGAKRALGETWLTVPLASHHVQRDRGYNEVNLGLGIEEDGKFLGYYRNSNRRTSIYAGRTWMPLRYDRFRAGLGYGVITGYTKGPMPMLLPVLSYEGRHRGVNVVLMPPIGDFRGALGFQLKWRID